MSRSLWVTMPSSAPYSSKIMATLDAALARQKLLVAAGADVLQDLVAVVVDLELGCGEIGVEIVGGALQRVCPCASGCDKLGNTASPHRDQREFGGDEELIGRHQRENQHNSENIGETADAWSPRWVVQSRTA